MSRRGTIPDPRARGFLRAWVSRALAWSATTKRLLDSKGFGEAQLAIVSLYLCLKDAHLLLAGKKPRLPGDEVAATDAPYDAAALLALRDRVGKFRHEIVHFSDKEQEGREVRGSWTREASYFALTSSVGQHGTLEWDTITRAEVEDILISLDPWLRRHWERLVREDPVDQDALRRKIDTTMVALGGNTEEATKEGRRNDTLGLQGCGTR